MTKTYAKGSGSRKARPTPKGEVQTAGLPALAVGLMTIAAPPIGYAINSAREVLTTAIKEHKHRKKMKELEQEDKDLKK